MEIVLVTLALINFVCSTFVLVVLIQSPVCLETKWAGALLLKIFVLAEEKSYVIW